MLIPKAPLTGNKGYTLIETIIYVAIFVVVVGSMMLFAITMFLASERADTQIEVADNSRFLIQKLQRALQGASAVTVPVVGANGVNLAIVTASAASNTMTFTLQNGVLTSQRGNLAPPKAITNSAVVVSNLKFTNYSFSTNSLNTVRVQATIKSVEPTRPASSSIDVFISVR